MALTLNEIAPGIVVYLKADDINHDASVQKPASLTTRDGPFVCFAVNGSNFGWAPISTQHRNERLAIDEEWRIDGSVTWREDRQYLNDGSTTYVGPHQSFVTASKLMDNFTSAARPKVTPKGIDAIVEEIRRRGGTLP